MNSMHHKKRLALAAAVLIALPIHAQPEVPLGVRIARAAQSQVGVTLHYDPAYAALSYPGGDVPRDRGVCTDVVVRAMRAVGVDLQKEVHEDMRRSFSSYPQSWGLRAPDRNIDHRRVPNLMTFFARKGKRISPGNRVLAGDIIAWRLPNGLLHIGIASDTRTAGGARPLMIHNIGQGARREDILHEFEIIGHYRW